MKDAVYKVEVNQSVYYFLYIYTNIYADDHYNADIYTHNAI